MAYAVNGELSTIDMYNSPSLFNKLYLKLLKSAAAQAAASPEKKEGFDPPTVRQLVEFITSAGDGKKRLEQKLDHDNVYKREFGRIALMAQLLYKWRVIHTQIIATDSEPPSSSPNPFLQAP